MAVRLLTPKNGQQLVVNTPQTLTVSAPCPAGVASLCVRANSDALVALPPG